MRIIIADDESLARQNLLDMIERLEFQVKDVETAENGLELVELVKRLKPDLAFVDIRMPELSGLEAIRIGKELSPNTQWVITSGFSEFEYAKDAISLEVVNYLLKPFDIKDLRTTLNKIVLKSQEFSLLLNKQFENELSNIFNDISTYNDNSEDSIILKSQFCSSVFIFDSFLDEKAKSVRIKEFTQVIREKLLEYNSGDLRLALLVLPEGYLSLVGAWGFTGNQSGRHKIIALMEQIAEISADSSGDDFMITVLQSDVCRNFDGLEKRLNQLQQLSAMRVIAFGQRKIHISKLARLFETHQTSLVKICDVLILLSAAYSEKVYMQVMRSIEKLESVVAAFSDEWENTEVLASIEAFIFHTTGCRIVLKRRDSIWRKLLNEHGQTLLLKSKKEESGSVQVIEQVKDIIEKSYMENISVNQIADMLNVSSSYLSFLFHKKTGETFLRYLTGFRMLKSRELLMDTSLTIQAVSERVGYYSTRHFTKLFREYFKEYPSDFRKKSVK